LKNTTENLAFNDISLLLAWITLGISLFHIIFPMELLNKKLFPVEDLVTETQTFEQARIEFSTDYDIENLITRKKALKAFMQSVQNQKEQQGPVSAEFKRLFAEGGIFSKLDAKNIGTILLTKPEDEEEVDFDFLDKYAEQVKDPVTNLE